MKTTIKLKHFAKHASTLVAGALTGLVVKTTTVYADGTMVPVIEPIKKLVELLTNIGIIVAGVALMWAFLSYLTAGDDSVKRDKAKRGIGIAVVAIVGMAAAKPFATWILPAPSI